jgi:hypothetical protein
VRRDNRAEVRVGNVPTADPRGAEAAGSMLTDAWLLDGPERRHRLAICKFANEVRQSALPRLKRRLYALLSHHVALQLWVGASMVYMLGGIGRRGSEEALLHMRSSGLLEVLRMQALVWQCRTCLQYSRLELSTRWLLLFVRVQRRGVRRHDVSCLCCLRGRPPR